MNDRDPIHAGHSGLTERVREIGPPERGVAGADILGPSNPDREAQEPFTLSPPKTDHGTMPNLKWSFADSHMRLEDGG